MKAKITTATEKPSLGFSSSSPERALDWGKACGMDTGKACGMGSGKTCRTGSGKACGTGLGKSCGMDSCKTCRMLNSPVSDGDRLGVVLEVVGCDAFFVVDTECIIWRI